MVVDCGSKEFGNIPPVREDSQIRRTDKNNEAGMSFKPELTFYDRSNENDTEAFLSGSIGDNGDW